MRQQADQPHRTTLRDPMRVEAGLAGRQLALALIPSYECKASAGFHQGSVSEAALFSERLPLLLSSASCGLRQPLVSDRTRTAPDLLPPPLFGTAHAVRRAGMNSSRCS